jgi:hypothetical protein
LDEPASGAAAFCAANVSDGTLLRAFGFPSGHKERGGFVDLNAVGPDTVGWLQANKGGPTGVPVRRGISGAPVWLADFSGCIGMISLAEEDSGVAHIIPYESIRGAAESIECLPRIAGSEEDVIESLMQLDFIPQLTAIGAIMQAKMFAVLLTGDDDHGQRALVERIRHRTRVERASVIKVELGKVSIRSESNRVHFGVGQWLDIEDGEPARVYAAIERRIQIQDTVILFLPGAETPRQVIAEIVSEFWKPLVATLRSRSAPRKRLLGIIVDEYAQRARWGDLEVATDIGQWRAELPLELPKLTAIDRVTLQNWVQDNTADFPLALSPHLAVDSLYALSRNGIPEWVFRHYCKMRALQWTDVRHKWIKS